MKKQDFDRIIRAIASQRGPTTCRSSLILLRHTFPEVPELTLRSILSQELCRKMKISHYRYKAKGEDYFNRYMLRRETLKASTLLTMASEIGINPALLARIILDFYLTSRNESAEAEFSVSKHITRMLRDTSLIDDRQLAQDVHICVLEDDQYGPLADAINHSLGQQYEHLLGLQLTKMKIPFLNEDQMRNLGMDKTPDIKLEVPVSVNGFIIHWIESKALYGSEEWHDKYIKKQLSTYWNRYGPGMVIYWFDFVDTLQPMHEKHLLVAKSLPENIVMMDPSKRQ